MQNGKRKATASLDEDRVRADALPNLSPNIAFNWKKQKPDTMGQENVLAPSIKVGTKFNSGIERLRDGKSKSIYTEMTLNIKKDNKPENDLFLSANFSVAKQSTGLTQGMLHSNGRTAYQDILPENLSLQRAKIESRVMKHLSPGGENYNPMEKISQIDELKMNKGGKYPKKTVLGGIAFGSFLEDITAKRAGGIEDIGSAMRAQTMATKWNINLDENHSSRLDFAKNMFESFPQLGKGDQKIHDMSSTGISALLQHWKKDDTAFTREIQTEKIENAHETAHNAAIDVFKHKSSALFNSKKNFRKQGQWWLENKSELIDIFSNMKSEDKKTVKTAKKSYNQIGEKYVERKMTRHGIKSGRDEE